MDKLKFRLRKQILASTKSWRNSRDHSGGNPAEALGGFYEQGHGWFPEKKTQAEKKLQEETTEEISEVLPGRIL